MTFIRFQYCPFHCSYCDTEYAQSKTGGVEMELGEILDQVKHSWVCITGGEPLCQGAAFRNLSEGLHQYSHKITVETSGLLPLPREDIIESWVVDVKCPSSGEAERNIWSNLKRLGPQDQIKFVVGGSEDLVYAQETLELRSPLFPHILISPIWGKGMEEACVDFVKSHEGTRLSLQLHKIIWKSKRGV